MGYLATMVVATAKTQTPGSWLLASGFWISTPRFSVSLLLAGIGISLILVLLSHRLGFLSKSGTTAAFFIGATVLGLGGTATAVPLLTFFFSSSFLSKIGRERKKKYDLIFDKGSRRDAGQVFGNGGLAWLLSILWFAAGRVEFYVAYIGALAAAQADTWATEIGTLPDNPHPRSVLSLKPVPPGTSGGVTWIGTLGGLLGAVLICASAWITHPESIDVRDAWLSGLAIGAAGLLGSLADSVLGATLQARFYDASRDRVTERTFHRSEGVKIPNPLVAGYRWITNDVVNFICTLAGAVTALLLLQEIP